MTQDSGSTSLLDVSPGGARLRQEEALEVGTVHDFAFELLGETIRVRGRVRHCLPEERGKGYEVGVQFVSVEPVAAQRLDEYTQRRRRRGRA
jgi:c-di-GMP-binding flagellar brake protein YcgR